ncbi:hypothetical protein KR222_011560, partial [Zaprionus bogoriensis]
LEQLQLRQCVVFESAQKQVAVLENLLKTVEPSWGQSQAKQLPAPQAYRFKDIYEQKKQQLLRQRLAEERSQRQFHSRPMPNFRQVHEQLINRQTVHRITCPITPNVLKTSRTMEQKRRQRVEQLLQEREAEQLQHQQLRPRTKLVPRFLALKPNNNQQNSTDNTISTSNRSICKPFRLSTELRAEQRKRFNAQAQQLQELRRRELEKQRHRQQRQEYQKQRQLATFRARPNPFRAQFE